MSGRCLAISNVLLHDLRGGNASEAIGSLRALHEASQLLSALSFHEEEEVVRRWLAGEFIRPREAREVQRRKQALALQRMAEAGIEPEGGDVVELGQEIYSTLSEGSHHQRSVMAESMAPALRRFAYGPHPDARNRASHVDYAGELLEEVIIIVGDAFADILGRDFYGQQVGPLQEALALGAIPRRARGAIVAFWRERDTPGGAPPGLSGGGRWRPVREPGARPGFAAVDHVVVLSSDAGGWLSLRASFRSSTSTSRGSFDRSIGGRNTPVCEGGNRCWCGTGGGASWWGGGGEPKGGSGTWPDKRELSPFSSTESICPGEVLVHDLQPEAGPDSSDDRRRRVCSCLYRLHVPASRSTGSNVSARPHRGAECLRTRRPVVDEEAKPSCLRERHAEGAHADGFFGVERQDARAW